MPDGKAIASTAQVQERTFIPGKRGRKPLVEIDPIITIIKEYSPEWVLFEIPSAKEANSVLRQLGKVEGMETTAKITNNGGKKLYARFKHKRGS